MRKICTVQRETHAICDGLAAGPWAGSVLEPMLVNAKFMTCTCRSWSTKGPVCVCFQVPIDRVKVGCGKHTYTYHGNKTESCHNETLEAQMSFSWFKQRHERIKIKSYCLCGSNSLGKNSPKLISNLAWNSSSFWHWHYLPFSSLFSSILCVPDNHQTMATPEWPQSPWNLGYGKQPQGWAPGKGTAKLTALMLFIRATG